MRAVEYFNAVSRAHDQAAESSGGIVDKFYEIAGYGVHLRFAGSALVPCITPALAHLETAPNPSPDLIIRLWDSLSTNTKLPSPPWQATDHVSRGEISGFNEQRIRTVFQPDVSAVSMLDASLDQAIYWVPTARAIPYYESSAPLRTILHWWMSDRHCQLLHAAAVGTSSGSALIAGKGGSGKSSTALTCLQSELAYVGDDYVMLGTEPTPYVFSLYNSAKLNANHLQRFPHLVSATVNQDNLETEKAVLYLYDHFPAKITAGLPVRAVLLPQVTGLLDTKLRRVSRIESLRALAPSTIFQLPGAGGKALQTMGTLVGQVPSFILELGTDLRQIPQVISELLSDLERK